MKIKHLIPVFLLITLGSFSSCSLFESADDVTFDIVLPLDFTINETAVNPGGKAYVSTLTLDASSNADVAKYASKIKEFKVNRVTYQISGANPTSIVFTNGSIVVNSTSTTIASASSVSFSNAAETDLNANTAGFNELADKLLDDKQEQVKLQGTLSATPAACVVRARFYVSVTADAL